MAESCMGGGGYADCKLPCDTVAIVLIADFTICGVEKELVFHLVHLVFRVAYHLQRFRFGYARSLLTGR